MGCIKSGILCFVLICLPLFWGLMTVGPVCRLYTYILRGKSHPKAKGIPLLWTVPRSYVDISSVSGHVGGSLIGIPPVLSQNIVVLRCCCQPQSATSGKVNSGVGWVETVLQAIIGGDSHAQSNGNLPWQLSSLQRSDCTLAILREKRLGVMIMQQIFHVFSPSLGCRFILWFHGTVCVALYISACCSHDTCWAHEDEADWKSVVACSSEVEIGQHTMYCLYYMYQLQ